MNLDVPLAKAAIIPDVHQDTDFLAAIYEAAESEGVDGYIFLGDYFDYHKSQGPRAGVKRTVAAVRDEVPGPAVYLAGNHDTQYLWTNRQRHIFARQPFEIPQLGCSGYSRSRAQDVKHYWPDFGKYVRPFARCQGFVLSHAGIDARLMPVTPTGSDEDAIERLYAEFTFALTHLDITSPLFWVDRTRGGIDPYAGPLWQDWRQFNDDLPWGQIVGHTARRERPGIVGRSVCLDNGQTTWGILHGGDLHFRVVQR